MYQIYDMDHDGLDEILALFPKSYYIYSPLYDSVLFSDTLRVSGRFSGLLPTDYDDDGTTDILILKGRTLYVQDGGFNTERQALVDLRYTYTHPFEPRAANMFLGDADLDGNDELIVGRLGLYYELANCPHMWAYTREENSGVVQSVGWQGWERNFLNRAANGEHVCYVDIDGDGATEIVPWGRYHLLDYIYTGGMYPSCDPYVVDWMQFSILDAAGESLLSATAPTALTAIADDINSSTLGDDIIVFKDGDSFEPGIFNPADEYALYCLGMPADTVELLWARDAESYEQHLFWIPSLPGTFCASTASDQYGLYSGNDGSVIGAVHGLTRGLRTEEGAFLPQWGPDDIQLVQLSGNSVNILQLLNPTDVDSPDYGSVPSVFRLIHNYPNPFNAGTTIEFSLERRVSVTAEIYNLLGQKVATLLDNKSLSLGFHLIDWDGRDSDGLQVSSGLYYFLLSTPVDRAVHKMLLLK